MQNSFFHKISPKEIITYQQSAEVHTELLRFVVFNPFSVHSCFSKTGHRSALHPWRSAGKNPLLSNVKVEKPTNK